MALQSKLSPRIDFVERELANLHLSFPPEVDGAYCAVCESLSTRMPCFDKRGSPTTLDPRGDEELDRRNAGREFTYLLPSHHMKVYRCLLKVESYLHNMRLDRDGGAVLDTPNVVVVDDGCGGGTASAAIISLLVKYQSYRRDRQLPVHPVVVNCVGVDPRDPALEIYAEFLQECSDRVGRHLVQVESILVLPGTLPANLAHVMETLARPRTHSVTLVLANLIRSLTRERTETGLRRQAYARLGLAQRLAERWGKDVGGEEISAVAALLESGVVDVVVVPLIAALGPDSDSVTDARTRWAEQMTAFQGSLDGKLSATHSVLTHPVEAECVSLVYPTGSYHDKYRAHQRSGQIEYDSAFSIVFNRSYTSDSYWQRVLTHSNLMLAWARVRHALTSGPLDDSIELRLFDRDVEERLRRLRRDILSYRWDQLAVAGMLNYPVPKGHDKEPRPMSLCRLEDQILTVALLQTKCTHRVFSHRRSYANRLIRGGKGEFLYEGWYEAYYEGFIGGARKAAEEHPSYMVIRTDISSFYTNIVQRSLFEAAEKHLSLYASRSAELAEKLILRDLSAQKPGRGTPQGHLASGAMANLYLYDLDEHFAPGNQWGIEYFRYVDDMILLFPPDVGVDVLGELDKVLSAEDLDLKRSHGKTFGPMTTDEFLEITAPDPLLEPLGEEHRRLLNLVYRLGRGYLRLAMQDWWTFTELYRDVLRSVGLYLPVPWLSRKLQKNLHWRRRATNWWWRWDRARMPRISEMADLRDLKEWSAEFRVLNSGEPDGWVCRRQRLVAGLSDLLRSSIRGLASSSQVERHRAGTRVRFAAHRLGQVGFGSEARTICDLLVEQPWLVNPRLVSRDFALQGRADLLLGALERVRGRNEPEWAYVRAVIMKAMADLSDVSTDVRAVLEDAAWAASTTLERTMASEALIRHGGVGATGHTLAMDGLAQSEDPYLCKNYILLHGLAGGDVEGLSGDLAVAPILHEALEYLRIASDYDDLYRQEPEVLRRHFYEGDYPDDPDAFDDFPYS